MENANINEFSPAYLKNKRTAAAVSVSAKLFLEKGIDNVKMTDIAEQSGIGVATLYRYFGTKIHITIAAMTYLWNDLGQMFSGVFESEVFGKQTGIKQLTDLMRLCLVLYEAHSDFMRLVGEFDLFVLRERVPKEDLAEYERSIINIYPYFLKAYQTGLADGTVREDVDFQLFYLTYAHASMELCKKLLAGELLPGDHFDNGGKELNMLIETAAYYMRKEQNNGAEKNCK